MSGIYIHIPFCQSKCSYCNFFSVASKGHLVDFDKYIVREIELRDDYLINKNINTIYFGGGTPTMMSVKQLAYILNSLSKYYNLSNDIEITVEANPDTLSLDYLRGLKDSGFNRISIGIQSFNDVDLKYLGRNHNTQHAIESISMCQEAGLSNISIDLIYNIPTQKIDILKDNLNKAIDMGVNHISAYSLTIEENTILSNKITHGLLPNITDIDFNELFYTVHNQLIDNGFRHYEVSNFARDGYLSRHNSKYWEDVPYIGLGPSAHSYNGAERQWNLSSVAAYKDAINTNIINCEKESLSLINRYNEYIMTRLRTDTGVNPNLIKDKFGVEIKKFFDAAIIKNSEYFDLNADYTVKYEYWNILDSIILELVIGD